MSPPVTPRARLVRSTADRVVAGVAGGISERLRVDAAVVRLAFVALAAAGGFGLVLYLFAWLVMPEGRPPPLTRSPAPATETRTVLAIAMVVCGVMVLLREMNIWFDDAFAWSTGLSALGSAILWSRDEHARTRFAWLTSRLPRSPVDAIIGPSKGRIAMGALLVLAGMATVLVSNASASAFRTITTAIVVTVAGVALILGPWVFELVRQLTDERRERIRSQERAEVAAHLHDSVLQTLAMIQRSSSPREMSTLARVQERELRAWLYGRGMRAAPGTATLRAAVDEMSARVERMHRVPVEAVVVGDATMDERLQALVDAAGEAAHNAARHSGASPVSVYAEVANGAVTVYVRDEGGGFDVAAVPRDRHGIAHSIVGRMERNGGTAAIKSAPGEGTEVHLTMPRKAP